MEPGRGHGTGEGPWNRGGAKLGFPNRPTPTKEVDNVKTPVSLWVFTILVGAAGGLSLAAALLTGFARDPGLISACWVVALGLTVVGGVAATLHLERPGGGHRVLRRWRSSWLSREVLATGLFGVLLALALWVGGNGLAVWAAAAGGVGAVIVTGALYGSIRAIRGWHGPLTVQVLLGLGMASGLALAGMMGTAMETADSLAGVRFLFLAAGVLTGAGFLLIQVRRPNFRSVGGLGKSEAPFPWLPSRSIKLQDRGTTYLSAKINPQLGPRPVNRMVGRAPLVLPSGLGLAFLLFLFLSVSLPGLNHIIAEILAAAATVALFLGIGAKRWQFFVQANHLSGVWAE